MGINGLNPLIKRHSNDAFFTMDIRKLYGKRIAIDAYGWMYANMSIVRKKVVSKMDVTLDAPDVGEIRKEWLIAGTNFALTWINNNVEPWFVFDGKNTPPEKIDTKLARKEKSVKKKEKVDSLYEQISSDILDNSPSLTTELRKALSDHFTVSFEDIEIFKSVLRHMGVPCLEADGDGEKLCSSLCIEGKVAAVFSIDTDNLVYGCPLVINSISRNYTYEDGKRIINLECVRIDKVLEGLKLTYPSFVDLCIMCGCDFNTHIPKYAAIKSYKLIAEHGSIDKLTLDTTCLKHRRCREIFTFQSSENLITNKFEGEIALNKTISALTRDFFDNIGIADQLHKIIPTYGNFKFATSGLIEALNLIPIKFEPLNPLPKLRLRINK